MTAFYQNYLLNQIRYIRLNKSHIILCLQALDLDKVALSTTH